MTEQELIALMIDAFHAKQILKPQRAPHPRSALADEKPVYSLQEFELLMNAIGQAPKEDNVINSLVVVRYLIQTDARILFARSGVPTRTIPVHQEMSSRCLSAGYLFFNNNQLAGIDHHSRDFSVHTGSLVFALRALFNAPEIDISPNLFVWLNHYEAQEQRLQVSQDMLNAIFALEPPFDVQGIGGGYETP
jgi:hypothetical protein